MQAVLAIFLFLLTLRGSGLYSQVTCINAFPNLSFSNPVLLTHSGDGTNRIFVVEKGGYIRVFANDSNAAAFSTFLNVTNLISTDNIEKGLLGLAFHPNYITNRYFYIYYTRLSDGAITIQRFTTMANNPDKADSLSGFIILTVLHPAGLNHNGGNLMFGQDGYLYTGLGDGAAGGDPQNNAQNTNVLLGKILRLDINNPSGGNNYGIPSGNPFSGGGGRPEIFAWGFRNPWRFSQDPVTRTIYLGDVGQDSWEEIDTVSVGKNYGWRCYEGNHVYNFSNCFFNTNFIFPIAEYRNGPPSPECAVMGGYVYRGSRIPALVGRYVYGDYCSRKIRKLLYSSGTVTDTGLIGTNPQPIQSFGVDQNNELYVCGTSIIFKFNSSAIGIAGQSIPVGYSLSQNFPNPFNPITTINFTVAKQDFVTLKIFNALGEELQTIVSETKQAGNYHITWDGANFPSGIYFYKLTSGDFTSEKKMVLIK